MSIKVLHWPSTIIVDGGIVCNPTPEQCAAAGYELVTPPTAEEIAAQQAARDKAAAELRARVETLRAAYRASTNRFCQVAGITVVDKFEDEAAIQTAIEAANAAGNMAQSLALTQLALALNNAIGELRRKDGDDAWERI